MDHHRHGKHTDPSSCDGREIMPTPKPGPVNTVTITVTAGPAGSGGQPTWSIQGTFSDSAAGSIRGDTITFNHGNWRSVLLFGLDDQSGLGLSWDSADPIWSKHGHGCPTGKGNVAVFKDVTMVGSLLIVRNSNSAADTIQFMLRFKDQNQNSVLYDPIISNGGGGSNSD